MPLFSGAQTTGYSGPVYQRPPTQGQTGTVVQPVSGKYQVLADKVAQLSANDQRQDARIGHLEHDVGRISATQVAAKPGDSSLENGTVPAPALIPFAPYLVRKGDTLWRIAMAHRVAPGDIIGFNRMPNDTVVEGQTLMIPQKSGAPKPGTQVAAGFHTVKPGESLGGIAKKYGVPTVALAQANPKVNPDKLMAGARLALPKGAKMPAPKPLPPNMAYDNGLPAPSPKPAGGGVHVVKEGESLSVIAHQHHVSTASLQKANNITDPNALRAGQKLAIPGGVQTAVRPAAAAPKSPEPKGRETKSKKSAATPPPAGSGLANAPDYPKPPVKPTPPTPPEPPPSNKRGVVAYRMEKGDTIDDVAHMFGTTSAEIRRLNRLAPNAPLHQGDEILVPGMGPVAGN
ncbi:MAG: LysM peptidoglycan-binding domain-containing protein [Verrucomicrobiaceae bacterium]|nr:LysM peptidoglycan-binding domain-containing protein [Verrucomicrobiaceae bacterium]